MSSFRLLSRASGGSMACQRRRVESLPMVLVWEGLSEKNRGEVLGWEPS